MSDSSQRCLSHSSSLRRPKVCCVLSKTAVLLSETSFTSRYCGRRMGIDSPLSAKLVLRLDCANYRLGCWVHNELYGVPGAEQRRILVSVFAIAFTPQLVHLSVRRIIVTVG
jgi:hypothetical protein